MYISFTCVLHMYVYTDVTIVLSEEKSNNEQRLFFGENPSTKTTSLELLPSPSDMATVSVKILV